MRLRSLAAALLTAASVVLVSMVAPATATAAPTGDGGVLTPNVVGGSPAPAYSFMGSLQNLDGSHFCGASVVHPNWALKGVPSLPCSGSGTVGGWHKHPAPRILRRSLS